MNNKMGTQRAEQECFKNIHLDDPSFPLDSIGAQPSPASLNDVALLTSATWWLAEVSGP